MGENPFKTDPFGEGHQPNPVRRLRSASSRMRGLKSQVGHDGFTPSAARSLLDELAAALDACATALEELGSGEEPGS